MTNREKGIVGLALLALVYGVYIIFFSAAPQPSFGGPAGTKKELDSLNAFITKVAEAAKGGLSEKDSYIIELAQSSWKQDPLLNIIKEKEPEEDKKETVKPLAPEIAISYTGYLEMGNSRLAIINGNEYEAGDTLEPGGFIVRSISTSRVVIVATDGSKNVFIVPLQDTQ